MRDGRLLISDSHRGLLKLDPGTGTLQTLVAEVGRRPLTFCSNVVESSDGDVYFTESTDRFRYEYYKGSALEARGSGHLFRLNPDGTVDDRANPNGSARSIAGIYSADRRVLGLMPHPEDYVDPLMGGEDGVPMFEGLVEGLAA